MFNQAARQKRLQNREGPRGTCLGPGTSPSSIWDPEREKFGTWIRLLQGSSQKGACISHAQYFDLPEHSLLFCKNKLEPFIVPSMKLAEQAWDSWMTQDDSSKGVLVPK